MKLQKSIQAYRRYIEKCNKSKSAAEYLRKLVEKYAATDKLQKQYTMSILLTKIKNILILIKEIDGKLGNKRLNLSPEDKEDLLFQKEKLSASLQSNIAQALQSGITNQQIERLKFDINHS